MCTLDSNLQEAALLTAAGSGNSIGKVGIAGVPLFLVLLFFDGRLVQMSCVTMLALVLTLVMLLVEFLGADTQSIAMRSEEGSHTR